MKIKLRYNKLPLPKAQKGLGYDIPALPKKLAVPSLNIPGITPPQFIMPEEAKQFTTVKGTDIGPSDFQMQPFNIFGSNIQLPTDINQGVASTTTAGNNTGVNWTWQNQDQNQTPTWQQGYPGLTESNGMIYSKPVKDDSANWQKFKQAAKDTGIKNAARFALNAGLNYYDKQKRSREFDRNFRNQQFDVTGMASPEFEGNYDINTGMFQPNRMFNPNEGATVAEAGGQIDNIMKIRITGTPMENMAYGGQSNYGLDLGRKQVYADMSEGRSESVSSSMTAVPRELANIEAEGGETVYGDLDGDGGLEHMKIKGKRHTEGGVPLNVPEGSFVFSDTKKMKIKDPAILAKFGASFKKGGVTPATIAKKYDINKYKAIMEDPNADPVAKATAQMMVKNYQTKLGQLALVQEGMKGFPGGIPQVAQDQMPEAADGGYFLPSYQGVFGSSSYPRGINSNVINDINTIGVDFSGIPVGSRPAQTARATSSTVDPGTGRRRVWRSDTDQRLAELEGQGQTVGRPINYSQEGDRFTLPSMQRPRNGERIFGDENWWDAEHQADFKSRHPEFFAENPNWDPRKRGDTLKFQNWLNQRFPGYFKAKGTGPKVEELDDAYGEYTYSAPSTRKEEPKDETPGEDPKYVTGYKCIDDGAGGLKLDQKSFKDEAAVAAEGYSTTAPTSCATPGKVEKTTTSGRDVFDYTTPDKLSMFVSGMYAPQYQAPWSRNLAFRPNRLALQDWQAQAQAIGSNTATAANTLGTYQPGQALASNMSYLQGQAADQIGRTIGATDAANVDRFNNFSTREGMRKDQVDMLNWKNMTDLYDKGVLAKDAFQRDSIAAADRFTKSFGNAWDNRAKWYMMNTTNPVYGADPRSGFTYFKNGYGPEYFSSVAGGNRGNSSWGDMYSDYQRASTEWPGLTEEQYLRFRNRTTATDTDGDRIPDRTTVRSGKQGGQVNPLIQFLMGGYSFDPRDY